MINYPVKALMEIVGRFAFTIYPYIHEIIDVRPMKLQFMLHVAGLLLLVVAVFSKGLPVYVAAIAVLVPNLLLLVNLAHAVGLYRKYSGQVIAVQ